MDDKCRDDDAATAPVIEQAKWTVMECPQCKAENPDVMRYCGQCGAILFSDDATLTTPAGPDESQLQLARVGEGTRPSSRPVTTEGSSRVKHDKEYEQDAGWLSAFEPLRTQADESIVQEVATAEEALVAASMKAVESLPAQLGAMRDVPKPRAKEMLRVRKGFLDGFALYIRGCQSHIKWVETRKPRYLSEWATSMQDAYRELKSSSDRLRVLMERSSVEEWRRRFVPIHTEAAEAVKELSEAMRYAEKKRRSQAEALPAIRIAVENLPRLLASMRETQPPDVMLAQDYHRHLVDAMHDYIEAFGAWLKAIETGSQDHSDRPSSYIQSAKAKSQRANQIGVDLMKWLRS